MKKENLSQKELNLKEINEKISKVHFVLANSYIVYFTFFIISVFLDLFIPIPLFLSRMSSYIIGFCFIFLASFLILWAQSSSSKLNIKEPITKKTFSKGPYRFTRTPTHFGLFFLVLGFGFVMNATFVIIFTLISFLITKFYFLKKQEDLLEKKYGEHYKEYKKSVKF